MIGSDGNVRPLQRNELSHQMIIAKLSSMQALLSWHFALDQKEHIQQVKIYYKKAMSEQYKRDIEIFFQHSLFWVAQESKVSSFLGLFSLFLSFPSLKANY